MIHSITLKDKQMKRILIFIVALLCTAGLFAQERTLELNKETQLIDVIYYHENGEVSQTGSYTLDGKLHGVWNRYDAQGNKQVTAQYDNGKKTGKWFYWEKDMLREVDYNDNNIASVSEWSNRTQVAVRD